MFIYFLLFPILFILFMRFTIFQFNFPEAQCR